MALLEKDVVVKKSKLPGAGKGFLQKNLFQKGLKL
jgi:hypothetical protein